MKYNPIELPYTYTAIQPIIGEQTMFLHYNKHYMGYIDKLNAFYEKSKETNSVLDILKDCDKYDGIVVESAGGYVNHSMLWHFLKPPTERNVPQGISLKLIDRDFGNFENFKQIMIEEGMNICGSGWVWWCCDKELNTNICALPNQGSPYSINLYPLLGIDLWEHAYYLKYHADKKRYLTAIWDAINWKYVNERIQKLKQ